MAVKLELVTES